MPHPFHLLAAWLEVAEVLFTDAGLFVDFDGTAIGVGCQGLDDTSGGLTGSCVGRCDDLDGVFGAEEIEEAFASFEGLGGGVSGVEVGGGGMGGTYLTVTFFGELYTVIGNSLVNRTVF